jgi:hypothetical protein
MYNYNVGKKSSVIALDYDDTYTVDPDLWLAFIDMVLARGHKIVVATMRGPQENEDLDPRLVAKIPVYFCNGVAKKLALSRQGAYPDIWIDDHPDWVMGNE